MVYQPLLCSITGISMIYCCILDRGVVALFSLTCILLKTIIVSIKSGIYGIPTITVFYHWNQYDLLLYTWPWCGRVIFSYLHTPEDYNCLHKIWNIWYTNHYCVLSPGISMIYCCILDRGVVALFSLTCILLKTIIVSIKSGIYGIPTITVFYHLESVWSIAVYLTVVWSRYFLLPAYSWRL